MKVRMETHTCGMMIMMMTVMMKMMMMMMMMMVMMGQHTCGRNEEKELAHDGGASLQGSQRRLAGQGRASQAQGGQGAPQVFPTNSADFGWKRGLRITQI